MVLLITLAIIGAYAASWWLLANVVIPVTEITWNSFLFSISKQKTLSERYGKWAVITGATDGIGKGYAQNLARRGMDLVLISRSEAKLMKVSREIQIATGVQIKIIVADFSNGESIYEHIQKELENIDVGILVNNVGIMIDPLDFFENQPQNVQFELVNVNISSMLMMTRIVLPRMKKARRGIIINISSTAAVIPAPYATSYTASKCFGHGFTLALQQELRGSGVECQLVTPGFVRTNMIENMSQASIGGKLLPDANQFGSSATWLIGKTSCTTGHWLQSFMNLFITLVPCWLRRRICAAIFLNQMKRQHYKAKRTTL